MDLNRPCLRQNFLLLIFLVGCLSLIEADGDVELCQGKASEVVCVCGLTSARVSLPHCRERGSTQCYPCNGTLTIQDICSRYKNCLSCDARTGKCDNCLQGYKGKYCEEEFPEGRDPNFQTIIDKSGAMNGTRAKRDVKKCCPLPDSISTFGYNCVTYPDKIKCATKCVWGYKLKDNVVHYIECNCKDRKWKPVGPEECKPYVNCDVKLIRGPAFRDCRSNRWDGPPYCMLSCDDEHPKKYTCTLGGGFFPFLPNCAAIDPEGDKDLVKGGGGCCCD